LETKGDKFVVEGVQMAEGRNMKKNAPEELDIALEGTSCGNERAN
jgi:hypothetical protein